MDIKHISNIDHIEIILNHYNNCLGLFWYFNIFPRIGAS